MPEKLTQRDIDILQGGLDVADYLGDILNNNDMVTKEDEKFCEDRLDNFRKLVNSLRPTDEKEKWISVSEPPVLGSKVAVYTKQDGYVPFVTYEGNNEWISDFIRWSGFPTHWMPLPSPPGTNNKGE